MAAHRLAWIVAAAALVAPAAASAMGAMMSGTLGDYAMTRDGSGTAWQPASSPMQGWMWSSGGWSGMAHGSVTLVQDDQSGPRGGDKTFAEGMVMGAAQHALGAGTLTLRGMVSIDPLMGPRGYPLLLQTGETADGQTSLVDRQHPHDLVSEVSATWSLRLSGRASVFVYAGYPGEPALGPVTFMHRFSGEDAPAAPISHHWLDSTHVTFGVATFGLTDGPWKLEGSVFTGREPDQKRWGFDRPRFDSWSTRLTWAPGRDWAFQVSYGWIHSPEQLEPEVNQKRITASGTWNRRFRGGNWQTTLAWGRTMDTPGLALDAVLVESALTVARETLFARGEHVAKSDLFDGSDPRAGRVFEVEALDIGLIHDIPVSRHLGIGLGVMGQFDRLPAAARSAYGGQPASAMAFIRMKLL